ncbi:DUF4259 domain-containing protein [Actinomadura darangshiensis]|uniref:DUF4259 domain-containing protein n=1 Tax=Actinomadura darangshiensis TaxID=705336 RepID=A0A4R5A0J2_9ACTN|nr:DUF4259 domain-containing protein [Actinomadura darangshiensis]TDD64226.1 DUF4259 domain-containing protein [Actinomadura darangshiensis]
MGTWDVGPFDNDHAADFTGDLDDTPAPERPALIRQALEAAMREESLDGHVGDIAVAAAAIVASQCPDGEPCDPVYGPEKPLSPLPADLRPLAVQALDRVTGPGSELADLWADAGSLAEWRAGVDRLRAVLSSEG